MKNISRRVFIKGMAVAAVATAASTVLAGCNVPGTTTETPVVGFKPETKTLTVGDRKVTVSTTGCGINSDGTLQVDLKFVNDGEQDITLVQTQDNVQADQMAASLYFDGKYSSRVTNTNFKFTNNTKTTVTIAKNSKNVSKVTEDNITVAAAVVPEEWSTLTLVFILCATVDGETEKTEVTFVLNK